MHNYNLMRQTQIYTDMKSKIYAHKHGALKIVAEFELFGQQTKNLIMNKNCIFIWPINSSNENLIHFN